MRYCLNTGLYYNILLTVLEIYYNIYYRKVRKILLDDDEDQTPDFFMNSKKGTLQKLQNKPGSLLRKFGEVTGIENFTLTDIR